MQTFLFTAFVKDLAGELTDPAAIEVTITPPSGPSIVFVYGTDPEILRVSVGEYSCEVDVELPGVWNVLWESTTPTNSFTDSFVVDSPGRLVTFTVTEAGAGLASGVSVSVLDGEVLVTSGVTVNGTFSVAVKPGSYVLELAGQGFIRSEQSFTVLDDPAPLAFPATITKLPSAPATSPQVTLYGYTGRAGMDVYVSTPRRTSSPVLSEKFVLRSSGTDGAWSIAVEAGGLIRVQIPAMRIDKMVRIPQGVASISFEKARPEIGPGAWNGVDQDVNAAVQEKRGLN